MGTPPDTRNLALSGGVPSALPSSAAVAAAAVTAQIQAMDAVASNMGLDSARLGSSAPSLNLPTATMGQMSLSMVNPQIAAMNPTQAAPNSGSVVCPEMLRDGQSKQCLS